MPGVVQAAHAACHLMVWCVQCMQRRRPMACMASLKSLQAERFCSELLSAPEQVVVAHVQLIRELKEHHAGWQPKS